MIEAMNNSSAIWSFARKTLLTRIEQEDRLLLVSNANRTLVCRRP